jgi:hypothetical protein
VGEEFSNDGVDRKPQARLRSVEDDLERRVATLKAYNPSAETIQFAADLGMNAHDLRMLGKFRDWHIENDKMPDRFEAVDAAYRNWIRDEPMFVAGHNVGDSPKRPGRSRLSESARKRREAWGHPND